MPQANQSRIIDRRPIEPNRRYGKLVAIEFVGIRRVQGAKRMRSDKLWRFRCDCGTETVVPQHYVRLCNTRSCGCGKRLANFKHGQTVARKIMPEYRSWSAMRQRCYNVRGVSYRDYGGRGITVCAPWRESFENFFNDMGPRPTPQHSLDRIDPNGNYSPENCRWATTAEQSRNKRRTRLVKVNGKTLCLTDACAEVALDYSTVIRRMKEGMTFEDAVSVPRLGRWTYRITPRMLAATAGFLAERLKLPPKLAREIAEEALNRAAKAA